jgi:Meckel syndrome type 1 protein
MTKLCAVCRTENRDEAQFCRACGNAFAAVATALAESADGSAANACAECGFRNKPGIRYCANCGMHLMAAEASAAAAPVVMAPADAGNGLPPVSYSLTDAPADGPRVQPTDHSPLFDAPTTPDIPDPAVALALRQHEGYRSHGDTAATFADAPSPSPQRTRTTLAIVAAVLVLGGAAAWAFLGRSDPAPPQPGAVPPPLVGAPVTPPPGSQQQQPQIIIEQAAPPAASTARTTEAPGLPASSGAAPTPSPAMPIPTPAAAPTALAPAMPPAAIVGDTSDAEARRIAAERRREKAARDKAERDARAKTLAEQREQSTAAQRAEQEAQARRRADEARTRQSAATPAPAAPEIRGVREICAGRGTIAEAVCQSRQCGAPEHANEPICRQLREADERRRNAQP